MIWNKRPVVMRQAPFSGQDNMSRGCNRARKETSEVLETSEVSFLVKLVSSYAVG